MDEVERPTGKNYKNYVLVQFMFISMNVYFTNFKASNFHFLIFTFLAMVKRGEAMTKDQKSK
jgi:hypothetical protein